MTPPDLAPPTLRVVLKHYNMEETRLQECSIFDRLLLKLSPSDYARFVRQRLAPSATLHQHTATELYGLYGRDHKSSSGPKQLQLLTTLHTDALQPQRRLNSEYPALVAAARAHDLAEFNKCRSACGLTSVPADSTEKRERDDALLARYSTFFAYYSGVMSNAIHSRSNPHHMRPVLRRRWFWQGRPDAPTQGDVAAMAGKALRFVLHCLQGLAAHHACGVLLGDIKPPNLFYEEPRLDEDDECRPVFGDYGHASDVSPTAAVTSACRIQRAVPNSRAAAAAAAGPGDDSSSRVRLVGSLRCHIGTWPYLAPETLRTNPETRSFDDSSDGYALALTLLEVLVGSKCKAHTIHTDANKQAESQLAYADGPLHEHLQRFAKQLHSTDPRWPDDTKQCAVLPPAISDCLLSMLHPQPQQRLSLHAAMQAVQIALLDCSN